MNQDLRTSCAANEDPKPSPSTTNRRSAIEFLVIGLLVSLIFGVASGSWWLVGAFFSFVMIAVVAIEWGGAVRIFCAGFLLGAAIEAISFLLILSPVFNDGQPAVNRVYPFTLLFDKVWPFWILREDDGSLVGINHRNDLKSMAAGTSTSGILFGILSLVAWYRLGAQRLYEKMAAPFHALSKWMRYQWTRQPPPRQRVLRIAFWLTYGCVVIVLVVGVWRTTSGMMSLLMSGPAFLLFIYALGSWLNARRSILK